MTGGILRHFQALSTPKQNPVLEVLSTPAHPQVTQTVRLLNYQGFINMTEQIKIGEELFPTRTVVSIMPGGMGDIYVLSNGTVAKSVKQEIVDNEMARTAFENEARFIIACDVHPCVIRWLDVQVARERLFLISEYARKGNLLSHISKNGIGTLQVANWAAQFCLGMVHMHSMGIVAHQDIKPENILIDIDDGNDDRSGFKRTVTHSGKYFTEGIVKIADFGLADIFRKSGDYKPDIHTPNRYDKNLSASTTINNQVIVGTPRYMAPEQFNGVSNEQTDLYSFGIVFFQMITGRFPSLHRSKGVPLPSKIKNAIPREFDSICSKLTALNPKDRYSTFKQLFVDLEPFTQGEIWDRFYYIQGIQDPQNENKKISIDDPGFLKLGFNREYPRKRYFAMMKLEMYEEALKLIDRQIANNFKRQNEISVFDPGANKTTVQKFSFPAPFTAEEWSIAKIGCLSAMKRYDEAISICEKVLSQNQNNWQAMISKAALLANRGHYSDAILLFENALSLEPNDLLAWVNMGICYWQLGNIVEVERCYQKVATIDSKAAGTQKLACLLSQDKKGKQSDIQKND